MNKSLELKVKKIMSIQEFAFQLSKKVQEQYSVKLARSHIYELIALYQGYKTYSAFVAQNLLIQAEYDNSEEYYQHELIGALTLEILHNPPETDYSNYDEDELHWDDYEGRSLLKHLTTIIIKLKNLLKVDISEQLYFSISKTIYRELLWLNLEAINFRCLREELSYIDFENGPVIDLEFEDEYFDFSKIAEHFEKILSYAKERNNADVYALIGAYYRYLANQIAPFGRSGSNFGSQWDNNKQKYILSDETKKNKAQYEEYIKQAEYFESYIQNSPLNLNEINWDADTETVYKQVLYLCNRGDVDAIEYFLYNKIFKTDEEAWLYIYIAQLYDVDFTQDDFRAYNAYTGEDYDDYGPMAISGREAIQYAINLPELNKEKDDLARKFAQELFEEI